MAGLLAARVLTDHFERVTLIERDRIRANEGPRKGVPQSLHLHGLLAKGLSTMEALFPNIRQELLDDGACPMDMGTDLKWYHFGGYKIRLESGLISLAMTRPFLEAHVRTRLLAMPQIELREETEVVGWLLDEGRTRLTGIEVRPRVEGAATEQLHADLMVDASGRGSRTPRWLEEAGYPRPEEETVKVDVAYATRLLRVADDEPMRGKGTMTYPCPPREQRMGVVFPIEGNRWIASLGGWGGDHAPADDAGFMAFARSLPTQDVANILARSEPLGDIQLFKFPSNARRRYEQLARFPERLVIIGDANCSFNPIYGQGMTLAALEALALGEILGASRPELDGVAPRFAKRVAKLLDTPWQMAISEDFRYPSTTGRKPPGTDVMNWFVSKAHRAAQRDTMVLDTFLQVMNMIEEPTALFRPTMLWRILGPHA
jgi:2-polyprenyl-6-methoxyphenol hydroxylase-like FAD-dependent oxidoreductase